MASSAERQCPRCAYPMNAMEFDGAEIDHCHRCGGTFVEPRNIKAHYGAWAQPRHWLESLGDLTTGDALPCPCGHKRMTAFRVPFDGEQVVVDHCDDCGSLWLDRGEGKKLARIVRNAKAPDRAKALDRRTAVAHDQVTSQQDAVAPGGVRNYLFQLFTGLPIEVWNPVRGDTPAMKTIIGAIFVMFALQLYVLVTQSPEAYYALFRTFGMVPAEVARGHTLYTVGTHMFMHVGVVHLLSNAYFLWIFGDNVEDRVGTNRFVLLYFAAGLAGAVLHVVMQPGSTIPTAGASGAIAGLLGAYMVLFPRVKLWVVFFFLRWRIPTLFYLGFWLIIQFVSVRNHVAGVAWFAHIGGFAVGLFAGWRLRNSPHPFTRRERRFLDPHSTTALRRRKRW